MNDINNISNMQSSPKSKTYNAISDIASKLSQFNLRESFSTDPKSFIIGGIVALGVVVAIAIIALLAIFAQNRMQQTKTANYIGAAITPDLMLNTKDVVTEKMQNTTDHYFKSLFGLQLIKYARMNKDLAEEERILTEIAFLSDVPEYIHNALLIQLAYARMQLQTNNIEEVVFELSKIYSSAPFAPLAAEIVSNYTFIKGDFTAYEQELQNMRNLKMPNNMLNRVEEMIYINDQIIRRHGKDILPPEMLAEYNSKLKSAQHKSSVSSQIEDAINGRESDVVGSPLPAV